MHSRPSSKKRVSEAVGDGLGDLALAGELGALFAQPDVQCKDERAALLAAHPQAFLLRDAIDLALDREQGINALNRFDGDRRLVEPRELEEVAPRMCPARCLDDCSMSTSRSSSCSSTALRSEDWPNRSCLSLAIANFICSITSSRARTSASALRAIASASSRAACAAITIAFSVATSSGSESGVGATDRLQHGLRILESAIHNLSQEVALSQRLAAATSVAACASRSLPEDNPVGLA